MEILKNSRQIPKKKEYTANKMYSDVVYAWLQVNSKWDIEANVRWIAKKDIKFTDMAKNLGLSRQTVSTKFKKLLDRDENGIEGLGLIRFNSKLKRYEMDYLPKDIAMLIEKNTLREMISALNKNTISVYVYLLSRYLANGEKEFEFTIKQVKSFIGISLETNSNDHVITDILAILKRIELVDYKMVTRVSENGQVRSMYMITHMENKLPEH